MGVGLKCFDIDGDVDDSGVNGKMPWCPGEDARLVVTATTH